MLIYLVRHGLPDYETDSLLPDGKLQAESVGRRLARVGIDEIYSSPLGRARETAAPLARELGLEVKIEEWTSERVAGASFGGVNEKGENVTWAFFLRDKLIGRNECYDDPDSFSHGYYRNDERAREGARALAEASDDFLLRLGFRNRGIGNSYEVVKKNDKRIALFAHQGFGLHWLAHLTKTPFHQFTTTFDIGFTGVTIIQFDEARDHTYPRIITLSDVSHLVADGIDTRYYSL